MVVVVVVGVVVVVARAVVLVVVAGRLVLLVVDGRVAVVVVAATVVVAVVTGRVMLVVLVDEVVVVAARVVVVVGGSVVPVLHALLHALFWTTFSPSDTGHVASQQALQQSVQPWAPAGVALAPRYAHSHAGDTLVLSTASQHASAPPVAAAWHTAATGGGMIGHALSNPLAVETVKQASYSQRDPSGTSSGQRIVANPMNAGLLGEQTSGS